MTSLDAQAHAPFERGPRCAVHPERSARHAPCARCGSYACEACFGGEGETLCAPCRERVGEPIAWERDTDRGVLARLWATSVQVLPAPFTSFEGIRAGKGLASALVFALLQNLLSYAFPMLLCAPCTLFALAMLPEDRETPRDTFLLALCAVVVGTPILMAGVSLVVSTLQGLLYHLAASVAGGTADVVESLRAAYFLNALAPVTAAVWLLGRIPLLGIVISLVGFCGGLVWQTFALAGHARGGHRIADQRAWLVAAVPALSTLALVGLLVVGLAGLVLAAVGLGLETPD